MHAQYERVRLVGLRNLGMRNSREMTDPIR